MANTILIRLRPKQTINDMRDPRYKDQKVCVCAPDWVKTGLKELSKYVQIGTRLQIRDEAGKRMELKIETELTPKLLQIIARIDAL